MVSYETKSEIDKLQKLKKKEKLLTIVLIMMFLVFGFALILIITSLLSS
jgi:uncharacterized membrane protein (DUF485 family)